MELKPITGAVGLGVFLVWIGSLVGILATGSGATKAVMALVETGTGLVAGALIIGGVTESEKGRGPRTAMVVMGAIIFVILMLLAFGALSLSGLWTTPTPTY